MRLLLNLSRLLNSHRGLLGFLVILFLGMDANAWWNEAWTSRKKITLDPAAGPVSDQIGTTVVLLRLYDGNFQFGASREDGSDIRFVAADDKTPLKFHFERYDGVLYEAFVWVRVPEVKPGAPVTFWMYSGNQGEPGAGGAEAKTTYDPETLLVYHFSEASGSAPADSTGGAHNAEAAGLPTAAVAAGGLRLTGLNGVVIPKAPDMVWIEGSPATISLWVKPTLLGANAAIITRRDGGKSFVLGMDDGKPFVEITGGGAPQRAVATTPLDVNSWYHLAVTVKAATTTLYVNGDRSAAVQAGLPTIDASIIIGKDKAPDAAADFKPAFVGEIDELEIAKVARPAGWIKLAALSQGGGDKAAKVVVFGEDEASKHGGEESELVKHFSLITDISKSLTVDGWVVIVLCVLLALIGGVVALTKFLYLNKIKKATDAFLKLWPDLARNLHVLDEGDEQIINSMGGKATPKAQKLLKQSPLYHIYQSGCLEIQDRLATARENFQGLSGRSMQAIRATLDGGLVRETHKLNSSLVFLTIGIAGGPYLGLLGTVIGVMITFAVIAKSGQVEVNSIAPGIAGALLATVAGLAVAIPALFAYSYISSRIKDAVSEMQIFIDEFVTKIAEFYSEPKR